MATDPQSENSEKRDGRGVKSKFSRAQRNDVARDIHEKKRRIADVAEECGITRQGVSRWLKHYREQELGLEPVARKPRKKKRFPTRKELHEFQWELRTRRPSQLGIDGGEDDVWDEDSVRAFLKSQLGEIYTSKYIWRWMEDNLIEAEPDSWALDERKLREAQGQNGAPPRESPLDFEHKEFCDGDALAPQQRKRGRPRKGQGKRSAEEQHEVRRLTPEDVERMEKEIAEVRQKMIADYRQTSGADALARPKPGERLGKHRKSKARHAKPKRRKRKKK